MPDHQCALSSLDEGKYVPTPRNKTDSEESMTVFQYVNTGLMLALPQHIVFIGISQNCKCISEEAMCHVNEIMTGPQKYRVRYTIIDL